MIKLLVTIFLLFSLSSCIELLDDIKINSDGSGTFKYTINLSSSKLKTESILALDSLDGNRVVKKPQLISMIETFKTELSLQPGIRNVVVTYDFETFIFKLSCDFDNVLDLESAITKSLEKSMNLEFKNYESMISINASEINRVTPNIVTDQITKSNYLNMDLLKTGTYTTITRLDKPVVSNSNELAKVSKSGQSVMVRVSCYELLKNTQILNNKISF
jgi:hypothetical protein